MEQIKDLTKYAGIPLALNLSGGKLLLGSELTSDSPGARSLEEMRLLFADTLAPGPALLYHLYRAVRRVGDASALQQAGRLCCK